MKKFLKIAGVLFLGAIGIGLIWYFQSLKIDGDPLLTACWSVDLYDDLTGEKVVGVEDLDFDPESGAIFLSAYDRRAVAREIEAGKVTTQGGIYTINVLDITNTASLKVTDISRGFKEAGNEFRPHGFGLGEFEGKNLLVVVNRKFYRPNALKFQNYEDGPATLTSIDVFERNSGKLVLLESTIADLKCDPNDVAVSEKKVFVTDSKVRCFLGLKTEGPRVTRMFNTPYEYPKNYISGNFYNGVLLWSENRVVISDTFNRSILFYDENNKEINPTKNISLQGGPDNLTKDFRENLYVTIFPNLLGYYFYMKSWLGVEKSPSAAYRISPETYEQTLLFKDDGDMISGATVALRAGDYLILGSGWDDHIAICPGMDGLD
ncbi:MAG: hypothetical protein IH901_07055 [Proteobacteria bacterium]|nr:hypothetical protein [Pseudomonadota bacterium]